MAKASSELHRWLTARGWTFEAKTASNHLKYRYTNGGMLFCASTPGDRRATAIKQSEAKRVEKGLYR